MSSKSLGNPDTTVLLARALDLCYSVVKLETAPGTVQHEAGELMALLAQFAPFVPEPGTDCRCGSGAVRLRNGQAFCYSCWMGLRSGQGDTSTRILPAQRQNSDAKSLSQGGLTRRSGRNSNIA